MIEKSKVPLLINSCEDDEMLPKSPLVRHWQQIRNLQMLRLATAAPTRRAYLVALLFAVISCMSIYFHSAVPKLVLHNCIRSKPAVKGAKEDAFNESTEWLIKHL